MPRVTIWREELLPGSETFIVNQMRALRRWTPALCGIRALADGLAVTPDFTLEGSPAPLHRADRRLYWKAGTSPRLHRQLRAGRLVHAHFGPDARRLLRAARIARRPLVATFHGYDATVSAATLSVDYHPLFDGAARLIAVSRFIRGCLVDAGAPEEKLVVVPIGIPVPPAPAETERAPRVLFVGRLVAKKGCADLLEALGGMGNPPEVDIIGDGPLRGELEELAGRLRLRVRFLGHQTPAAVAEAMTASALLCAPSKTASNGDREGLGMVLLEAAAQRLPVVAYASGGIPEAVVDGETGILVAEGNIQGLARGVDRLLADPSLARRLGASGRARVEAHFDIRACTAALERLYDDVVSASGTPRVAAAEAGAGAGGEPGADARGGARASSVSST